MIQTNRILKRSLKMLVKKLPNTTGLFIKTVHKTKITETEKRCLVLLV